MSIERMTADDIDTVVAIEQRVQHHPWTAGNFRDALAAGNDCWLQREDGTVTAFAVTLPAVEETELLVIGVSPELQRSGRGKAMLDFLVDKARLAGMTRMLLEVRPSNAAAIAFYAATGFIEIGRRRGYYPAALGREDAIVMSKNL